VMTD